MRSLLRWTSFLALAAAIANGCGSGSDTSGFGGGGGGDDGGGSDGSNDGDDDSYHQWDGWLPPDSGGHDVHLTDGGLDVAFPDAFFGPDAQDSGSSSNDSGAGDSGCSPNGVTCQGNTAYTCNNGVLTVTNCAQICLNGYGCVVCQPGSGSCNGNVGTLCKSDGSGYVTNNCDPQLGETCVNGACTGDCANVGQSYIGCEYYAITMSNQELNQSVFFYSVSISNTSASNAATILITGPNGFSKSYSLAAGAIQNYQLPWVTGLSCPAGQCDGQHANAPASVRVNGGAYHIKSTEPITVYQFNAYNYEINQSCASDQSSPPCHSYTNDASLLIPVNALTGNYYTVTGSDWHTPGFTIFGPSCSTTTNSFQVPGLLAIVATQNNTSVTVATTGPMQTVGALGTQGGTISLNAGDVVQIASALNANNKACTYGSDLSGSKITATAPVEVLGGHDCTFTPANTFACDHLEQINFPLETLRGDYLVTLPNNNNGTPHQWVKIVGTAANTTLTTDPVQNGVPGSITAGQVVWFETTQHFHLTSSNPVIVGQFMEGQYTFNANCQKPGTTGAPDCGDPSMSLAVATSQFRKTYQFIAPPSYYQNWVNVIAPANAAITIDGNAVNGWVPIGNSGYSVAYVSLCGNGSCNGVHSASGNVSFGIEVYGYGYFTSYMYPGGLDLTR